MDDIGPDLALLGHGARSKEWLLPGWKLTCCVPYSTYDPRLVMASRALLLIIVLTCREKRQFSTEREGIARKPILALNDTEQLSLSSDTAPLALWAYGFVPWSI